MRSFCRGSGGAPEVRRYCGHIFAGLAHLHAHGVCHRDLCMPNMLLSYQENTIQIADLGMAASAASFTLERNVSQMHVRAPEVLLSRSQGGASASLPAALSTLDLWSAGIVVAALHFGKFLFQHETPIGQIQAMVDFLGHPLPDWPGVRDLRLWPKFETTLREPKRPCKATAELLTSKKVVRRALSDGHPAIHLTLALLKWDPAERLPAQEALRHKLFEEQSPDQPSPARSNFSTPPKVRPLAGQLRPARVVPDMEPQHAVPCACACKGSCGRAECSRAKSRRSRQRNAGEQAPDFICGLQPVEGRKYCSACICAVRGCSALRLGGCFSRFCTKHDKQMKEGHYCVGGEVSACMAVQKGGIFLAPAHSRHGPPACSKAPGVSPSPARALARSPAARSPPAGFSTQY